MTLINQLLIKALIVDALFNYLFKFFICKDQEWIVIKGVVKKHKKAEISYHKKNYKIFSKPLYILLFYFCFFFQIYIKI